jgi:hypothetical protein
MKTIAKPTDPAEALQAPDWRLEVELNDRVESQYIVRIFEVYETDAEAHLIMEFCAHGTLASHMVRLKRIGRVLTEAV